MPDPDSDPDSWIQTMIEKEVALIDSNNRLIKGKVSYSNDLPCHLELDINSRRKFQSDGEDVFQCLQMIRLDLENQGIKILCNGARKNVSPSGMGRQMSNGQKIYVLNLGQSATELVDIFDPAEVTEIGTVAEQLDFYKEWVNGFKREYKTGSGMSY